LSDSSRLVLQATLLSLVPGLFWLWFVESHRPTQASWVRSALSFVGGAASTLLVLAISAGVVISWPGVNDLLRSTWGRLFYFVVIVGMVEEFCKLLSVRLFIYPRKDFKEAWDGLAASSAAALGFATAENVKYILESGDTLILLPRSVLSTTGHVLMSGIWGYALGVAKTSGQRKHPTRSRWVLPALLTAAIGHGAYDFFLIQELPWLAIGVLGLLWAVFWAQIKHSVSHSQRRLIRSFPVRECPACHTLNRPEYSFCTHCGLILGPALALYCQICLEKVSEDALNCPHCRAEW
jgi:RsiW-degrading membrane proteinase PrsW (M82 family)